MATSGRRTRVLPCALGLLTAALLLGPAVDASAHAALVDSDPAPGTELQAVPGTVELGFSEPIIEDLSSAVVRDPDGREWVGEPTDDVTIEVHLRTSTPGIYEVRWKTVSPVDGHTLRGTFAFGVGVSPGEAVHRDPLPAAGDLVVAVARTLEYVGLLAAVGALVLSRLARRDPPLPWARRDLRLVIAAALSGGVVVVVGEVLLAGDGLDLTAIGAFLSSEPGGVRLARVGTTVVALVGAAAGLRGVAAGGLVAAFVLLSAAGHAAGTQPAWFGVAANAGHLIAAGMWAGVLIVMPWRRPPGGWRSADARDLVRRFTPLALLAFTVTVVLGSVRGIQELVGLSDLVRTAYGRVLLVKVALVAAMVPLSLRAWRGRQARPRTEAGLAVVVVAAAAVLAAFPVPPQRLAADAQLAIEGDDPSHPGEGDLTLGGASGDVLVGLTVRPGQPGTNDVFLHLMPTAGEEAADALDVTLTVAGRDVAVEHCAATCRRGRVQLSGGEDVAVHLGSGADPASFSLPALPAQDATADLEDMVETMGELRTYRYEEVLGPADPPIRSEWAIQAPNRLYGIVYDRDTGGIARETYRIGDARYNRSGPGDDWEVNESGPRLRVPIHIWDYPGRVAAHRLGQGRLDEVEVTVLSFFIDLRGRPIWYRTWVDGDDLVHRAEMRTRGHFMDHAYSDFNEPFTIEPPAQLEGSGGS